MPVADALHADDIPMIIDTFDVTHSAAYSSSAKGAMSRISSQLHSKLHAFWYIQTSADLRKPTAQIQAARYASIHKEARGRRTIACNCGHQSCAVWTPSFVNVVSGGIPCPLKGVSSSLDGASSPMELMRGVCIAAVGAAGPAVEEAAACASADVVSLMVSDCLIVMLAPCLVAVTKA